MPLITITDKFPLVQGDLSVQVRALSYGGVCTDPATTDSNESTPTLGLITEEGYTSCHPDISVTQNGINMLNEQFEFRCIKDGNDCLTLVKFGKMELS